MCQIQLKKVARAIVILEMLLCPNYLEGAFKPKIYDNPNNEGR